MNIKNLLFFDNYGYNLNLQWNTTKSVWEGSIFLPKVSLGLYANTNIYIMEDVNGSYVFPQGTGDDKIVFRWDIANKFVDEFFMFNFDEDYEYETSALIYTPNNGPDVEKLIINRFDIYEVPLDSTPSTKPLPVHIAFSSPDKYNATTFKRTLDIFYNTKKFAEITFFAETVEEDERLKTLNKNLGYNIKPKDTIIFKDSDIKECYPDYMLLNEKRKELMMEGHNIYPYIGSYKAIVNVIKFFGYENLNIIEYWKNIDNTSDYFGMVFASSKYSLTNKETLNIDGRQIPIPNKSYRKMKNISLVYTINHPTEQTDELEIPIVVDDFKFTMEEVLIKLFALRRKLNEEFMPASSRIVDIIGEATYFCLAEIMSGGSLNRRDFTHNPQYTPSIRIFPSNDMYLPNGMFNNENNLTDSINGYMVENLPEGFEQNSCNVHITDSRQFIQFVIEQTGESDIDIEANPFVVNSEIPIINLDNVTIDEIATQQGDTSYTHFIEPELYEDYYSRVMNGYLDDVEFEPNTHDFGDLHDTPPKAKVVLENTSFTPVVFGNILDNFNIFNSGTYSSTTFGNIDSVYYGFNGIKWKIQHSTDQIDEDLKKIGVDYEFEHHNSIQTVEGDIESNNKIYVELPYTGYYDVIMSFKNNGTIKKTFVFNKVIKVEQYQPDIRGFYYDARELPEHLQYDISEYEHILSDMDASDVVTSNEYTDFILARLSTMTTFATTERITQYFDDDPNNDDIIPREQSMPVFGYDSDSEIFVSRPGPFEMNYVNQHWALLDHLNYDITTLRPNLPAARYIKNAVDVKPYTWFLLGFDESKISGVVNPIKWTLTNLATNETMEHEGKYFTLLLKEVGDYKIDLSFEDMYGNKYSTSRTIVIVDENANYNLYQRFKEDYDSYIEAKNERDARMYDEFARLNTMYTEEDESE